MAETQISWTESDEDITFYRTIILDCDYIRDIEDSYQYPVEFTTDSVEEARQFFKKAIIENLID